MVTFGYFWSFGPQDQKYTLGGGIRRKNSNLHDSHQRYQDMVLSLNILLLVTFCYFSSCGRQDQKYTFGGGIYR